MIYDVNGIERSGVGDSIISSISIEYGRLNNESSYYFVRIPKYDINGNKITPKVALTSADGTTSGTKVSTLNYAKRENTSFVINASLFNTSTKKPEGPLVINGVDMTTYKTNSNTGEQYAWMDSDMGSTISSTECYPLLINANGDFYCYPSEDRTATENQPASIIAAGYKYAVTAWGMIVNNFVDDSLSSDEIVHQGKYIRQIVGQFQNGDYFVMSIDKTGKSGITAPTANEAGANYGDLATFLIAKGVKFAYSLDGGGSCETVLGQRHVNPIFEGTTGRPVPTVIYWSIDNN